MDRWTERFNSDGEKAIAIHNGSDFPDVYFKGEKEYDAMNAFADYEDLEEQGLLVRLPCKVGDILYCIDNGIVETLIVNSFRIYNFNRVEIDFENASGFALCTFAGELDEGYFLSREEAEKKLEELRN